MLTPPLLPAQWLSLVIVLPLISVSRTCLTECCWLIRSFLSIESFASSFLSSASKVLIIISRSFFCSSVCSRCRVCNHKSLNSTPSICTPIHWGNYVHWFCHWIGRKKKVFVAFLWERNNIYPYQLNMISKLTKIFHPFFSKSRIRISYSMNFLNNISP